MTVKLMLTCLCDAFYGEVGIATARVLEHAGCAVEFPKEQTCCGQPPFNAGDWPSARIAAQHWMDVFEVGPPSVILSENRASGEDSSRRTPANARSHMSGESGIRNPQSAIVVTPSSSCAAMIREGYHLLFDPPTSSHDKSPIPNPQSPIEVWELGEFLVKHLKIDQWPLGFAPEPLKTTKIVYHRACHGRGLGLSNEQEVLLASIPGVELVPLAQPEQCCGFGGAFSVGHQTVSAGIGTEKLRHVIESGAKTLVSGDMGCLMHLRGLIEKQGLEIETRHFAEILADHIPAPIPT